MKLLERISTVLSIAIFTICCALLLVFGISGTGWKALSIPTGSMRPAIPPGSLVLVHRVPISSLKIGDVITYINPLKPSTTLTHRIVKEYMVDGTVPGFVTKGDANKLTDIPITAGAVEGKVIRHSPHIGYWLMDAKKPYIILPIIYGVALLIMAEEVIRLKDYLKSKQPYKVPGLVTLDNQPKTYKRKVIFATSFTAIIVIISGLSAPVALALLKSNPVVLGPNNLIVAKSINRCSGNSNNNTSININSSSNQSASTGSVTSTGNINAGSATSGNATNSNNTNINVSVSNSC